MAQTQRRKSNSLQQAQADFKDAAEPAPIEWPPEISELPDPAEQARAVSLMARAMESRARRDWASADYPVMAQWAQSLVLADRLQLIIATEGFTISSPKNPDQKIRHPALDALGLCSSRTLALARMIGLNIRVAATVRNGAAAAAHAREVVGRTGGHSLLAGYGDDDFSV